MDILVNYAYREDDVRALFDVEALAAFVIRAEGRPDTCEASVSFVADEEIRRLNREFRGVDAPTDVLSFECDNAEDDFATFAPAAVEVYELGDIVVAPDVAERQAPGYGLSLADEVSLLVCHGMLHLCGWDHVEDAEAAAMEARERELLTGFWGRPFERSAADGEGA